VAVPGLAPNGGVRGADLTEQKLRSIKFEQKLNGQLNLDLGFVDEEGSRVRLRRYFGEKPAIVMMGYYECPMLCNLVLNGVVEALQEGKGAGMGGFTVLFTSIDPKEKPELAKAKLKTYLKRRGPPGPREEWHFLTGDAASIGELASEIGFQYAYESSLQQFAHPSGIVVVTPEGKISKYLLGVRFGGAELASAIKDAESKKIGSPVQQLILLCSSLQLLSGPYSKYILGSVRVFAALLVLGLAAYIIKARKRPAGGQGGSKRKREKRHELSPLS
jgi:protein SCO1/2